MRQIALLCKTVAESNFNLILTQGIVMLIALSYHLNSKLSSSFSQTNCILV